MLKQIRPALVMILAMTLITGVIYPLAVTGIAQLVAPGEANGSLVERDGKVVGSSLIGQNFHADRYFWPRPSATSAAPYDASASSGSNLGPTSEKLKENVEGNIAHLRASGVSGPFPADAVMASGSGLDPDISPQFALMQVARVATVRKLDPTALRHLVKQMTDNPLMGIFGEPRVNVLELNLALDKL